MRVQDLLRWIAVATPFVACAVFYIPTLTGAFLSDDYAVVGALFQWTQQRSLPAGLLHQFYSGLDSPSNYYRPLTFVSFGINYVLAGADPFAWRLVNLCTHLTSGALLFAIVRKLASPSELSVSMAAPALAAAIFLLFPTNPEAVAWVSGRYDLLATFFMLAAVALFQRSAAWFDRWGVASLVAAACALASKESAVLVPVLLTAVAIARRATGLHPLRLGLRDAAPCIAVTLAYFALRAAIFGDPLRVYPGTSPAASLVGGEWLAVLMSMRAWFAALLPLPLVRSTFLIALASSLSLGAAWCSSRHVSRVTWWSLAASALVSVVIVLPHLQTLSPTGEQGRLFYSTSALIALIVAFPLTLARPAFGRPWLRRVAEIAAATLIVSEFILVQASIAPWSTAGAQENALLDNLPSLAMSVPATDYAFILVPDHIGPVPFGRNAQGGMISPPTQAELLSSRLIAQTPDDLPAWPGNIGKGLVDALRRYPLARVWTEIAAGHVVKGIAPTHYFCWGADETDVIPVDLNPELAKTDWLAAWRDALSKGRCAVSAADVPKM